MAFVVSMSTPWMIMDSLNKWSAILKDHIQKLNIPEAKRNECLKKQCRLFQMYQDPDETNQSSTTTTAGTNNKKNAQMQSTTDLEKKTSEQEDDLLLPLDPSILTKNLGIQIIVILTKSDSISILDKENEYRIEHFDFIQYHIRHFCLDCKLAIFIFSLLLF